MTSLVKRRVDQPIIFNARAVREELKAQFQSLEFWTCTLELKPSYQDSLVSFRRGQVFISMNLSKRSWTSRGSSGTLRVQSPSSLSQA